MIQHDTYAQARTAAKLSAMVLEFKGMHDVFVKEHPGQGFVVVAEGRSVEMHRYAAKF